MQKKNVRIRNHDTKAKQVIKLSGKVGRSNDQHRELGSNVK